MRVMLGALALWLTSTAGAAADLVPEFGLARTMLDKGDVSSAMPLLRRIADAGYAPAQVRLADLLDKSEDDVAAVAYYRKAAEQGDADGAFGLGSMYTSGEGIARNVGEALRWMRVAAQKSHPQAIEFLAQAYQAGGPPLAAEPDFQVQAEHWQTLAAGNGFVPAMDELANAYRSGRWGGSPDEVKARAWQQRAAAARQALVGKAARKPEKSQ